MKRKVRTRAATRKAAGFNAPTFASNPYTSTLLTPDCRHCKLAARRHIDRMRMRRRLRGLST